MRNKIIKATEITIYIIGFCIPILITVGRILIPDTSYDTINYHIFAGDRGINWTTFIHTEFYPLGLWSYFPLLDMVNNIGRNLFGYRLGTITQVLFFYFSILLIFLLIRELQLNIQNRILGALFRINIFITLEALFQLATYLTDIINTTLFLLFLIFLVRYLQNNKRTFVLLSTLLLSLLVLCKYTNYFYFIPYALFVLMDILSKPLTKINKLYQSVQHLCIYIFVNGPWMIWNYINTHNPIFPYFNSIFHSELYAQASFNFDQGPKSIIESIFYPFYVLLGNAKINQYFSLIPDYKFCLYIFGLLAAYPLMKKLRTNNPIVWYLYKYYFLCYGIWVVVFGYSRYAIGLEFLAGILVFAAVSQLEKTQIPSKKLIIVGITLLFCWQDISFVLSNLKYDISWRPTLWTQKDMYIKEIGNIANNSYTYPNVDGVDFYWECGQPVLGYMVPSNLVSLPVLNLSLDTINQYQYLQEAVNRLPGINNKDILTFVSIIKDEGWDLNNQECNAVFETDPVNIIDIYETNFLGYENIRFKIVKGTIDIRSSNILYEDQ